MSEHKTVSHPMKHRFVRGADGHCETCAAEHADTAGRPTGRQCGVCEQPIREAASTDTAQIDGIHHLAESPYPELCFGCFAATVELEKFLVRARPERTVMGNWTRGWLQAILADPRKFL